MVLRFARLFERISNLNCCVSAPDAAIYMDSVIFCSPKKSRFFSSVNKALSLHVH